MWIARGNIASLFRKKKGHKIQTNHSALAHTENASGKSRYHGMITYLYCWAPWPVLPFLPPLLYKIVYRHAHTHEYREGILFKFRDSKETKHTEREMALPKAKEIVSSNPVVVFRSLSFSSSLSFSYVKIFVELIGLFYLQQNVVSLLLPSEAALKQIGCNYQGRRTRHRMWVPFRPFSFLMVLCIFFF